MSQGTQVLKASLYASKLILSFLHVMMRLHPITPQFSEHDQTPAHIIFVLTLEFKEASRHFPLRSLSPK